MRRWLLLLFPFFLYCADYDYIVIGSSPIPLFEALYQHSLGKRVLVLEGACCLGGAWQSIDICGVQHADLGCHMIGNNEELANFFEVYAGCSIVSLDTPKDFSLKSGKNGFYFAHGCYELMNHLQEMIQSSSIDLLFNQKAYSATVDTANNHVVVQTKDHVFTTEKVVITPYTRFCDDQVETCTKIKFHHLYLLIHDPTPPRFTYSWGIPSTTRMMNITDFVDLENTGMQLIIFQTHNEDTLQNGSTILQQLKEKFDAMESKEHSAKHEDLREKIRKNLLRDARRKELLGSSMAELSILARQINLPGRSRFNCASHKTSFVNAILQAEGY